MGNSTLIGIDHPIDDFLMAAIECGACDDAIVWLQEQRDAGVSMREMIALLNKGHQDWAVWARTEMGERLTHAVRVAFSDVATRNDPRIAAHLDIYFATSRTEGDMLSERWNAEELPNIARQLNEGIIERRR